MIALRACIFTMVTSATSLALGAPPSEAPFPAQTAQDGSAILGKWKLSDQGVVVEIVKSGSGFVGTIVQSPEGAKMVGKVFLRGVSYDAAHDAWNGEIFAPKRSEYVPMTAKMSGASLRMTAGKGPFSKDLSWSKA